MCLSLSLQVLPRPEAYVTKVRPKAPVKRKRSPEYTCILCSRLGAHRVFRSPIAIKRHLAIFHNDKEYAVYVSSPKGNQSILHLCPDLLCRFSCPVKAGMTVHHVRNPAHVKRSGVPASEASNSAMDRDSSVAKDGDEDEIPLAKLTKDPVVSVFKGKTADKDRAPLKLTLVLPKTAPGKLPDSTEPIFVVKSRDGKIKERSLVSKTGTSTEVFSTSSRTAIAQVARGPNQASSSVLKAYLTGSKLGKLKCLYCGYPATFDQDDLKNHLLMEHPREDPIVANANANVDGRQGSKVYFMCPVLFCPTVLSHRQEFITHIKGAHQDMEFSIPLLNPRSAYSEINDEDDDDAIDFAKPMLDSPKVSSRQRKRKFDDSDDERDADFDPRRPNYHPDYPGSGGKKSRSRRKLRNKKPSQQQQQQQITGMTESTTISVSENSVNSPANIPENRADLSAGVACSSKGSHSRVSTSELVGDLGIKDSELGGAGSIGGGPSANFQCHLCSELFASHTEIKAHIHASHAGYNGPYACTDLAAKKKRKRSIRRFCPKESCDFMTDRDYDYVLKHLAAVHEDNSEGTGNCSENEAPKRRTRMAAARSVSKATPAVLSDSASAAASGSTGHPGTREDLAENTNEVDGLYRTNIEHGTKEQSREQSRPEEQPIQAERQDTGSGSESASSATAHHSRHANNNLGELKEAGGDAQYDTRKDLEEIGEELSRLNQDLEKWFGSSKAFPVPPKSCHSDSTQRGAEIIECIASETLQGSSQGSVESPTTKTLPSPGDHMNEDSSEKAMAHHSSDSASSAAEEAKESESDDCEMPDISDSRFSPRRATSDMDMGTEEEEKLSARDTPLSDVPRKTSTPCGDIENNDDMEMTGEEGVADSSFSSAVATSDDITGDKVLQDRDHDPSRSVEEIVSHTIDSHLDTSGSTASSRTEENRDATAADTSNISDSWRSDERNSASEREMSNEKSEEDEHQNDKKNHQSTMQNYSSKQVSNEVREGSWDTQQHQERSSDLEPQETSSEGEQLRVESEFDSKRHHVGGAKMYQCHECSFMTTSHTNIEQHMVDSHESSKAGFMEIDTGFDHDGNIITNVNG